MASQLGWNHVMLGNTDLFQRRWWVQRERYAHWSRGVYAEGTPRTQPGGNRPPVVGNASLNRHMRLPVRLNVPCGNKRLPANGEQNAMWFQVGPCRFKCPRRE